ncbi:MAG: septum formation initiator family protein [Clostridia bacterium]|nr:septum formation initiator family protein [Clostridia bacterium]
MSAQKTRKGWWITPLIAFMLVYAAFTYSAQSNELYAINLEMKQIEQKIQKETELKEQLLEQKDEISSDESIEKIAREKLGMVRDGERVFVDTNK